MMKKSMLMVGILAVSLAFAGCGKKEDTKKETSAAAEAATEAAATESVIPEGNGEIVDEIYFEGEVIDLASDKITIKDNDGNIKSFVMANTVVLDEEYPLIHGCYAEVAYSEADSAAEPAAIRVTPLMSNEEQAAENGSDPYIYGKVRLADQNDLIIDDINGQEVVFDNSISRSVSFNGISEGTDVIVTYIGTLDKEAQVDDEEGGSGAGAPIAIKIVAVDAATSEDAQKNTITGTVNMVNDGILYLDTFAASFEFKGDASVFAGLEGEENVTVTYEGSLNNLAAEAKAVTIN